MAYAQQSMTETTLKVVELGCKLGNGITEFIRRGSMYYGPLVRSIDPAECLGIDIQERFRADLESRRLRFRCLDLTADGALEELPEADYYLAWDFLEHLPNMEWVSAVIQVMLRKARKGVWIRMPSFEQDKDTGEGVLRAMGLRFSWSVWHGHKCHVLVSDVVQVINEYKSGVGRSSIAMKLLAGRCVRSTDDPCVVPIDSPVDTVKYDEKLGPKPIRDLNPDVVAQWEVVVTM